jgi:tripartite-type tricarboxylate transporter receptor subunit TctC
VKLTSLLAALAIVCGSSAAQAQGYPSRPITMIVPFPAGGPTDTLGRIISEGMRPSLGQTIVIENVTGAGSTIGVGRAAQAPPDGYTLSLGNWTSHMGAGALYPIQYDLVRDFEPISLLTFAPMLMVAKTEMPVRNAKELIAWLKDNPGKALSTA